MDKKEITEQEFLKSYNANDYPRPSVTVDVVVFLISGLIPPTLPYTFKADTSDFNLKKASSLDTLAINYPLKAKKETTEKSFFDEIKVLLIKRGNHPSKGKWAFPGGFLNPDETLTEAALRELNEETGLALSFIEQLYTFSDINRDPRTRIISTAFWAITTDSQGKLAAGSDADEALWFLLKTKKVRDALNITLTNNTITLSATVKPQGPPNEPVIIDNNGIAFDHAKMLFLAIRKLKEITNTLR